MSNINIEFLKNPTSIKLNEYDFTEKDCIIKLGMQLYNKKDEIILSFDNEQNQKYIENLNNKHNISMKNIETKLNIALSELDAQKQLHRKTMNDAVEMERTKYENQINSLNKQLLEWMERTNNTKEQIEMKYDEKYNTLLKEYQQLHSTLSAQNESKIKEMFEKNQEYMKEINTLRKELFDIQTINNNSSLKGKYSEEKVFNILNRHLPSAEIIDTHKESAKGDFIVKVQNVIMMVETKDYSKNVPKREIDKFYRDLDVNSEINCAVFISQQSGISKKENMEYENYNGKHIFFIHNFIQNDFLIAIVYNVFKQLLSAKNNFDFKEKNKFKQLNKYLKNIKKIMDKQLTRLKDDYVKQKELCENNIIELAKLCDFLSTDITV